MSSMGGNVLYSCPAPDFSDGVYLFKDFSFSANNFKTLFINSNNKQHIGRLYPLGMVF